jgi:hypothetical protein
MKVSVTIRSESKPTGQPGFHDTPVMVARSVSESGSMTAVKPAGVVGVVVVASVIVVVGTMVVVVVVDADAVVGVSSTGWARVPLPHAVTSTADATSP